MAQNQLYVVLSNSWWRRPAITKRRLRRCLDSWEHFCLCGSSSTEQILQTVHSPPALSLLRHIVCALAFHSGWGEKIALRATEQTVEKGACHLYSVPRRTCLLLFFIWAPSCRAEPRVWCQKAELIALSQRGGPPITNRSPKCFIGDY